MGFGLYIVYYNINIVISWRILGLRRIDLNIILVLDYLSSFFCAVIFIISGSVFIYRDSYINEDKTKRRFYFLVFLFVISILIVILSPNFIRLLLGWDGLGLVSYCLVIYYQNRKSYGAGILTIIRNRLGDVGLLLAIGGLMGYGRWTLSGLWTNFYWWIIWCVLLAGLTKSAQIPFSAWLPAAIAAPTPVSALVHSSTLVTAGVYLLIRFYEVINEELLFKNILLYIGLVTIFLAGLTAIYEYDLKKIIALSTLRQLGLIMAILGFGIPNLAFFHLLTHAIFKALLFLSAGKIIHSIGGSQDIRVIGGLIEILPLRILCISVARLALCGFPFLAGFYSKDLILEIMIRYSWGWGLNILLIVGTSFTCIYTIRLGWILSGGEFNGLKSFALEDNERGYRTPILILLIGAIFGGARLIWFLFINIEIGWNVRRLKLIPSLIILGRLLIGVRLVEEYLGGGINFRINTSLLAGLGGLFYTSGNWIIKIPLRTGLMWEKILDKGWGELVGGQGIYIIINKFGQQIQIVQRNTVKIYLLIGLAWGVIIIMY